MKKIAFILILSLLTISTIAYASPDTSKDLSNNINKEIVIESEDELLEIDILNDQIDTYVMYVNDEITPKSICPICGYNGLNLANIYDEYDIATIKCPMIGWPTGECFLIHYKVYRGVRCINCRYEDPGMYFLYDKVKSMCHGGAGEHWVIPDKTHDDGIDVHECPCPMCLNVYFYLADIEDLH